MRFRFRHFNWSSCYQTGFDRKFFTQTPVGASEGDRQPQGLRRMNPRLDPMNQHPHHSAFAKHPHRCQKMVVAPEHAKMKHPQ